MCLLPGSATISPVRMLAVIAFLVLVGAASGITVYELRSHDAPPAIKPIELEPARERTEPPKRPEPEESRTSTSRSDGGANPAVPEPAPAGEPTAPSGGGGGGGGADDVYDDDAYEDDDDAYEGGDDEGDDDGGDD